jgi:hypothetical protein
MYPIFKEEKLRTKVKRKAIGDLIEIEENA